jgi:hypothetical protein
MAFSLLYLHKYSVPGLSVPYSHWPLSAVHDLTRDGRLSTYDESVLKLSQGFIPEKMRTHGTPSKATITNKTHPAALQRKKNEISKQIFPAKEYRGLSPNFHIHAFVSDLYIPTIGLSILLEEICRSILGLYKSLTDT